MKIVYWVVVSILSANALGQEPPRHDAKKPPPLATAEVRADAPDRVKQLWRECRTAKADALAASKADVASSAALIKEMEAGSIAPNSKWADGQAPNGKWIFKSTGARQDAIDAERRYLREAEKRLATAEDDTRVIAPELELKVGSIGGVAGIEIVQVQSDHECIAHLVVPVYNPVRGNPRIRVLKDTVWLSGLDLKDVVDGKLAVPSTRVFEVVGTKQYQTVNGGARTIYELHPFDIRQFLIGYDIPLGTKPTLRQHSR